MIGSRKRRAWAGLALIGAAGVLAAASPVTLPSSKSRTKSPRPELSKPDIFGNRGKDSAGLNPQAAINTARFAPPVACTGLLFLASAPFRFRRKGAESPVDPLATPLIHLTAHDPFTVRDLLNGGVCIMGRSGSGKTSSSGMCFARELIHHPRSGGLILAAKPEDPAMWKRWFAEAGRSEDLLIFAPDAPLRFNFLDHVLQSGGSTREVTRTLMVIGETLRGSDTRGGENADFWEGEQTRMIYNAVEILRKADGKLTPWNLQRFIADAAANPAQIHDPAWQDGVHFQAMWRAFNAPKAAIEQHDHDLARLYWFSELPAMNDRTRTSISTGVFGLLHVLNTGIVRELVGTTTTVTPDDLFRGKWVLVNMPPPEFGDMGACVNAGFKYLTQRAVLRRHAQPGDAINVIWCDEYHQYCNSYDAHYLAQSRSHLGAMVVLTQSVHGLFSALKGEAGKAQANMLLSNFHTKIAHALGDSDSANFFQNLIGRDRTTFIGGSTASAKDPWHAVTDGGGITGSFSEQVTNVVEAREFTSGLRTGGPPDFACDAIVVRSGQPFSTGNNWLRVTFSQR